LLEARWMDRLQEVTELALAFHEAGAEAKPHRSRQLMRRAVRARRALADTDEALSRLAGGQFGRCEDCSEVIPADHLFRAPEARYCRRCA
jgi:RNA polymerase-binding transcription factor DksA